MIMIMISYILFAIQLFRTNFIEMLQCNESKNKQASKMKTCAFFFEIAAATNTTYFTLPVALQLAVFVFRICI